MGVVWLRLGDASDYQSFENIGEVGYWLAEAGILAKSMEPRKAGLEADPGFRGCNYISLYWGDDDEQPELDREFTAEEFQDLRDSVAVNTLLLRCKEGRHAVDVYREGVPEVVSAIEAILPDWDCNDYETWTVADVIAHPDVKKGDESSD